ncbi:hypothetical protein N7520_004907 [Penicillium odoratum]|uniref:uncharacterized protein n=1 Tax=Penicillium odoratum TaxID=1167516 RepID=UPI0025471795|nr:uncharacterized protein N7520_004907 [Penicillium odoratum]KAJ5765348.1 hypothetical protein N7520_004907 [Penicillium odoratum]
MDTQTAMSLLKSIRSQLTIDFDADLSPPVATTLGPQDPEPTDSRRELIDSEPFPDYDDESTAADEVEQAYQDAFTAAVQEEIRTRVVELNILILDHIPVDQRLKTLDAMKGSLSHPQLRSKTRMRFIALTNMVIRLENALFSVSDEESFLNPKATTNAQSIANVILAFASWLDGMMQELLSITGSVDYMLGLLIVEDVAWVTRYRRMALLVSTHLKKPRRLEEVLLSMYLELYDEWVHNTFLRLRNAQITQEENLDFDRLQLTRTLHAIWDVLSRAIERYGIYRDALHSIKGRSFSPAIIELSGSQVARCFDEDTV